MCLLFCYFVLTRLDEPYIFVKKTGAGEFPPNPIINHKKLNNMKSKLLLFSALALCSATAAADNYPSSLYVLGDATSAQWNTDDAIRMVTVENGVYEYTGDLTENGRIRFVTTYDFAPGYGPAMASTPVGDNPNDIYLELTTGSHELEYRNDYYSPDKSFKVMTAGRYKFRVDLTGEKPVVEVSDATGLPDQSFSYPEVIYPIGNATNAGWAIENSYPLHETSFDSGVYSGTMFLNRCDAFDGLKFMVVPRFNQTDNKMYVAAQPNQTIGAPGEYDLKYTLSGDEDWKFSVTIEGLYDVTVDITSLKMTISEAQNFSPEKLWLVGDAVGGWSFDDNKVFVKTETEGEYSYTGDFVKGEFKFYAGNKFGAVAYGAESNGTLLQEGDLALTILGSDDNKFSVSADQAANYTLTVDLKNMKLNAKKNNGSSTVVEEIEVADWVQNAYGIVCEKAQAIALYDISGRKVASVNGTMLPFEGMNAGVYVLAIETPQGRTTAKIVIR